MRDHLSPNDLAAMLVAVLLVLGIIALALLDRDIPAELSTALGAAGTWLFVRSAQAAEHRQANIRAQNGVQKDPPEGFISDP